MNIELIGIKKNVLNLLRNSREGSMVPSIKCLREILGNLTETVTSSPRVGTTASIGVNPWFHENPLHHVVTSDFP